VAATRQIRGEAAVQGVGRAALASLAAGTAGAVIGVAVTLAAPAGGKLLDAAAAVAAAAVAVAAFGAVAYVFDKSDLRTAVTPLLRLARLRP
jgi:hypothetical protein